MVRHNNNVVDEKCRSGDEDVLCAMAKKAVDRSGGQLEVFVGEDFVDDDLLKYIADRAPSLKVLRTISCDLSGEAWLEAINKFPLLEELKLFYPYPCGPLFDVFGKACPNLKIFKLDKDPYSVDRWLAKVGVDDVEPYGIATMHGLRYLKIICSALDERGLKAILDNCPHLEFIDLCYCPNLLMMDKDNIMLVKRAGVKLRYGIVTIITTSLVLRTAFVLITALRILIGQIMIVLVLIIENPDWSDHDNPLESESEDNVIID